MRKGAGGRGRTGRRWLMRSLLVPLVLGGLTGCTTIEPWVKPYEREHLADPLMSLSRNSIAATYRDHVFETREGSHGATGAVGGGCGCN